MQYSCWEERKRPNYVDVKVQCMGENHVGKVKILNADDLEKMSENLHTEDEDIEEESDTRQESDDGEKNVANHKNENVGGNNDDEDDDDDEQVEEEEEAEE